MFHQKTKPKGCRVRAASIKPDQQEQISSPSNVSQDEVSLEEQTVFLQDLLELRKYRKRTAGLEAGTLLKDSKDNSQAASEVQVEFQERDKKTVMGSFTVQTNVMDANKHMMKYIEEEMKKIRGQNEDETKGKKAQTREAELYGPPENLRAIIAKPKKEGNPHMSTSLLTSITEVDLGIDMRLKNIEETERAKRQLHDHHSSNLLVNSVHDYQPISRFSKQYMQSIHCDSQNQSSTDDLALERFKKRLRY